MPRVYVLRYCSTLCCCSFVSPSMCVYAVVESHPDNVHDDLRLDRPFDGFSHFCDSLDLSAMTRKVSDVH